MIAQAAVQHRVHVVLVNAVLSDEILHAIQGCRIQQVRRHVPEEVVYLLVELSHFFRPHRFPVERESLSREKFVSIVCEARVFGYEFEQAVLRQVKERLHAYLVRLSRLVDQACIPSPLLREQRRWWLACDEWCLLVRNCRQEGGGRRSCSSL